MQTEPKIRTFLWTVCHNALATKANLFHRHISPTPICSLCTQQTPETIEHLFLFCPWTTGVWKHPKINISVSPSTIQRLDDWITEWVTDQRLVPGLKIIAQLLWQIWRLRNNWIFRCQFPDPNRAVADALAHNRLQSSSAKPRHSIGTDDGEAGTQWKPPDCDSLKCNIDGSYFPLRCITCNTNISIQQN